MSRDDIFRITYSYNNFGGQTDHKIYQGNEVNKMLTDLLEWELDNRAFPISRPYHSEGKLNEALSERWRKWLTGKKRDEVKDKPTRRQMRLEKHTTEGWVEISYEVVEPKIVLGEPIILGEGVQV